ncbi:MAG: hypothetical protein MEP44_05530, partial [Blastomonas sp.]|nr:hypothetical protein [Blastomonas sp.]
MRKDDPAGIRLCLPIPIPCIDEFGARSLARFGNVDMAGFLIPTKRHTRPAGSQLARRFPLPVDLLPPDRRDL